MRPESRGARLFDAKMVQGHDWTGAQVKKKRKDAQHSPEYSVPA